VHLKLDSQPFAHCPKNGNQLVHIGIACWRQHPVQTLARFGGQRCELLKANGGVNQITQDQAGGLRFTVEEQGGRLIQPCLRK
jgi:hypothetical protein